MWLNDIPQYKKNENFQLCRIHIFLPNIFFFIKFYAKEMKHVKL